MSTSRRCLYLFSSNQSPLYAQDILNVLGAPEGHPYRFRYDAKYVTQDLQQAWAALQDTPVLVVFSLQQKARFQAPAFIPIRSGYVLRTHREGESYFVEFRITRYVGLCDDGPPEASSTAVARFTQRLGEITEVPYAASVSIGPPLEGTDIESEGESSVLFARTGSLLALTDTFSDARFIRILGIREAKTDSGPDTSYLKTYPARPLYRLKARSTYDLVLFHAQPAALPIPAPFQLFADGSNVRLLGSGSGRFALESRYDEMSFRLATADATGLEDHETSLVLEPDPSVQGPTLTLKLLIEADKGRAVGVASTQAVALLLVALAGVLSSAPMLLRIALAVVGALAAVALGLVGAAALRPPTLPSSNTPAPHSSAAH